MWMFHQDEINAGVRCICCSETVKFDSFTSETVKFAKFSHFDSFISETVNLTVLLVNTIEISETAFVALSTVTQSQ